MSWCDDHTTAANNGSNKGTAEKFIAADWNKWAISENNPNDFKALAVTVLICSTKLTYSSKTTPKSFTECTIVKELPSMVYEDSLFFSYFVETYEMAFWDIQIKSEFI